LFAALAVSASPITVPSAPQGDSGQVFELQDYRWVPVVVRRVPTLIDCSFDVVTGTSSVQVELLSERDFRRFARHYEYETLEATPAGRSGHFQYTVETPGRYEVLIRNQHGAPPVAVSLAVRTEVDPQNDDVSAGVTPLRRFVVILASLMVFSGTAMWSGRRLLRAWRTR
jgi:hypothetical protein